MKKSLRLASCAAGFMACALTGALAQEPGYSIVVDNTFDYPGSLNQTRPQKISDKGEIAGIYVDGSTGASHGFTLRGTIFSQPITDPNDAADLTEGRGVNNMGIVCGDYTDSSGLSEGFFLRGSTFTNYAPDPNFTIVLGINNAGDFCGSEVPSSTGIQSGFTNIGGVLTDFTIPNAAQTLTYMINSSNFTCGYFNDQGAVSHGWWADGSGNVHQPIDPQGSTQTILFGNNDSNIIVGRYADTGGATHAIVLIKSKFLIYDFPGSTFTSFNGINRKNQIVGRYTETATGIDHGILAHLVKGGNGVMLPMASPNAQVLAHHHPADNPAQ